MNSSSWRWGLLVLGIHIETVMQNFWYPRKNYKLNITTPKDTVTTQIRSMLEMYEENSYSIKLFLPKTRKFFYSTIWASMSSYKCGNIKKQDTSMVFLHSKPRTYDCDNIKDEFFREMELSNLILSLRTQTRLVTTTIYKQ